MHSEVGSGCIYHQFCLHQLHLSPLVAWQFVVCHWYRLWVREDFSSPTHYSSTNCGWDQLPLQVERSLYPRHHCVLPARDLWPAVHYGQEEEGRIRHQWNQCNSCIFVSWYVQVGILLSNFSIPSSVYDCVMSGKSDWTGCFWQVT